MVSAAAFPLIVGNILLCEDVRPEPNGKHSALGIYGGDLLVQKFEGSMRMALYLELTAKNRGEVKCEVNLAFNNVVLAAAQAGFDFVKPNDPAILIFPMFPLTLTGPGILTVNVISNGKTQRAMKKEVRQADLTAFYPSASQPPSLQSPTAQKRKAKRP